MRIALAQALFVRPDLLLLDEPTNHLYVHAITWLEEFLRTWEKTVVCVSHDRTFLNETCAYTIFLHKKRLWYYGGSYDTFLRVRAEQRKHREDMKAQQDRKVDHLKSFIAKFGRGRGHSGGRYVRCDDRGSEEIPWALWSPRRLGAAARGDS